MSTKFHSGGYARLRRAARNASELPAIPIIPPGDPSPVTPVEAVVLGIDRTVRTLSNWLQHTKTMNSGTTDRDRFANSRAPGLHVMPETAGYAAGTAGTVDDPDGTAVWQRVARAAHYIGFAVVSAVNILPAMRTLIENLGASGGWADAASFSLAAATGVLVTRWRFPRRPGRANEADVLHVVAEFPGYHSVVVSQDLGLTSGSTNHIVGCDRYRWLMLPEDSSNVAIKNQAGQYSYAMATSASHDVSWAIGDPASDGNNGAYTGARLDSPYYTPVRVNGQIESDLVKLGLDVDMNYFHAPYLVAEPDHLAFYLLQDVYARNDGSVPLYASGSEYEQELVVTSLPMNTKIAAYVGAVAWPAALTYDGSTVGMSIQAWYGDTNHLSARNGAPPLADPANGYVPSGIGRIAIA